MRKLRIINITVGAISYAEIALVIGKSGEAYIWFLYTIGPAFAFMQIYLELLLQLPSAQAGQGLSVASYLFSLVFGDGCGDAPHVNAIILAIAVMGEFTPAGLGSGC